MQVRHLFAAALLTVSAVGAMAQEIDARDQHPAQAAAAVRTRESVQAEVRNLQAAHAFKGTGELAQAPVTGPAAQPAYAQAPATREQVKAELATWRAAHKTRVGELG
jgi:type IV secretory pathway TrbL component